MGDILNLVSQISRLGKGIVRKVIPTAPGKRYSAPRSLRIDEIEALLDAVETLVLIVHAAVDRGEADGCRFFQVGHTQFEILDVTASEVKLATDVAQVLKHNAVGFVSHDITPPQPG